MRERVRRLSRDQKPVSKLRSALTSVAVVAAFIVFILIANSRMNTNAIHATYSAAIQSQEVARQTIGRRFELVRQISQQLEGSDLQDVLSTVPSDIEQADVAHLSEFYTKNDIQLGELQKLLFVQPDYGSYALLFERIYEEELALVEQVGEYHQKADLYNLRIRAFPSNMTARKLGSQPLELFTITPVLKGRP